MKTKIKYKIKKLLPDRIIYLYIIIKLIPDYLRAKKEIKTKIFPDFTIIPNEKTVNLIINENKSLSRFGDGEFMWILDKNQNSYQDNSPQLAQELLETLQSNDKNLLIGIPGGIIDSSKCRLQARMHWLIVKNEDFSDILKYLNPSRRYCDASITRPYIDYNNKVFSQNSFNNLKRIWDKRKVVIVEGEKTKLGMGNNLFDNTISIQRIICPAQNAYEKIDRIMEAIRKYVHKDELILAALGPTATILVARACQMGFQAIDIGHIDIEYMWFLSGTLLRKSIEGKYVNESSDRICTNKYDDDSTYLSSIIEKVL